MKTALKTKIHVHSIFTFGLQCTDRAYGVYGLKRLRVHRVNRLKSLKRAFFSKRVNGAYRSYGVGKIDLQC